jgi:hypothetical protein
MEMTLIFDINYFENLIMSFDLEFVQGNTAKRPSI